MTTAPSDPRTRSRLAAGSPYERAAARVRTLLAKPGAALLVLLAIVLALSWQFITDASRAVPAFDTAYYQWRAELLQFAEPGRLIELRGASGALAAGYRVAESVLGALMRTVGGVGAETPTVVLSVLFRVLAAVGLAAFAWQRRRSWLLFYVTLVVVPALFLLQRFFGYLDNFLTLALLAGVLLLIEPMRRSWTARLTGAALMFVAGLSHPTTLVIFILAMGVAILYHLLRERSFVATIREWWAFVGSTTLAVLFTGAFWMGGLWGPTSSFGDAAVPPPASVDYFLNRSVGVLQNLQPLDPATASSTIVWGGVGILVGLMLWGFVHLLIRSLREREEFATVTVDWTLPLAGMAGFLIGAAYPYFRFFNATLSPLLLAALGITLFIGWSFRRRTAARVVPVIALAAVAALVAGWWFRGVGAWNSTGTWLTPEVRTTTAASRGFIEAMPEGTRALFVVDQPSVEGQTQVPYGAYKEFANALYAGLGGEVVAERLVGDGVFFGTVEDLAAGRATETGDEIYDDLSETSAANVLPLVRSEGDSIVVLMPALFNEESPNASIAEVCRGPMYPVVPRCREIGESGVFVLEDLSGPQVTEDQLAAGEEAAQTAAAFAANPPGPFEGIGGTLLAILRLGLLLVVPGLLFFLALRRRAWVEGLALVPMLSIGVTTTIGVFVLAIVRGPLSPVLGWATWGIASVLGLLALLGSRRRWKEPEAIRLLRGRDFGTLMGAQWFAQAADGLTLAAIAKLITFGGQAGFDVEAAKSPEEAFRIVLFTFLPLLVLSPFLGVLIDRWDRRRLLIGANGLRAIVLAAVAVLGFSAIGAPALYGVLLLTLASTRLLLAIKGAALPATLGEQDLIHGNSVSQAGSSLFYLAGAGVSLVAAGLVSAQLIVAGGVIVYAIATAFAFGTRTLGYGRKTVPLREEIGRMFRDIAEGVREVARRPRAGLALVSFLAVRSLATIAALAVVFASLDFLEEAGPLGTVIPGAAGAAGAIIGFFVALSLRERTEPGRIVAVALVLGGAGMVAFGGVISLLGISLVAFGVGVSFFLGKIAVDTLMQQGLADSFRGRGFSFQDAVYNLSWILPSLVLVLLFDAIGPRALLIGAGVLFLLAAGGTWAWAGRVARVEPARPRERAPEPA